MTLKAGTVLRPAAGSYIVVLDPLPDKTEGGLHLVHSEGKEDDNPYRQMARILVAGPPFTDKNGIFHMPEFAAGDRIIVAPGSVFPIPHASRRIGAVAFSSVVCRFGPQGPEFDPERDGVIPEIE